MREIEDREWSEWRETGRHKRIAADGERGELLRRSRREVKGKSKREENEVSDDVPQL